MQTLIKLVLAPVLLWQGRQVRRKALILPEPPGPRSGAAGDGPILRLLILGDSSAAGVGASHQSEALSGQLVAELAKQHRVEWQLIARTGATSRSTLKAADDLPPCDVAVLALGVNDVTSGTALAPWLQQQAALRQRLKDRGARQILISGVPPMQQFPLLPQPLRWVLGRQARQFNTAMAKTLQADPVARHLGFELPLEPELMAQDGFHPSPAAYALWAQELAKQIGPPG